MGNVIRRLVITSLLAILIASTAFFSHGSTNFEVTIYSVPNPKYFFSDLNAYVYMEGSLHFEKVVKTSLHYSLPEHGNMARQEGQCHTISQDRMTIGNFEVLVSSDEIDGEIIGYDILILAEPGYDMVKLDGLIKDLMTCIARMGFELESIRVFETLGGIEARDWLLRLNKGEVNAPPTEELVVKHFGKYGLVGGIISGNYTRVETLLGAYELLISLDSTPSVDDIKEFLRELRQYIPDYVPIVVSIGIGGSGLQPLTLTTQIEDPKENYDSEDQSYVSNVESGETTSYISKGTNEIYVQLTSWILAAALITAITIYIVSKRNGVSKA